MKLQELAREAQLSWRLATQGLRPKPERVGWLVGSGRSGTTWISSLLNADASMREVFEPIHVLHSPLMSKGPEHPYFRPDQVPKAWRKWQQDVFEGRYITRRTDQDNLGRNPANAGKLLIKDVFACGMVAANLANHSAVAPALIMRHPIAVALSKKAHKHWFWTWSPEVFLGQSEWVEDHLFRHKDFSPEQPRRAPFWKNWSRSGRCCRPPLCALHRRRRCQFCITSQRSLTLGCPWSRCQNTHHGRAC